jgi:Fe-S-cluster containining protein
MSMELGRASFTLKILGQDHSCSAAVPAEAVRVQAMLPVFNAITSLVVQAHAASATAAGRAISCRAGCGACCRQPVPITHSEARRIVELVESMPEERRAAVRARFDSAMERLRKSGLLAVMRGETDPNSEVSRKLAYRYFDLGIPCPFLEDESCSIHEDRPLRCREYLVTSPAAMCAEVETQPVEVVPIFNRPSEALAAIGRGDQALRPGFIALVQAFEWAKAHETPEQPVEGPAILQHFLRALSGG